MNACSTFLRRTDGWLHHLEREVLPNALAIHTLVLDLNLPFSDAELNILQKLLKSATGIANLAISWGLWSHCATECNALPLKSLYLHFDNRWPGTAATYPSLRDCKHPTSLRELVVYAPPDLRNRTPFRSIGNLYLPTGLERCTNLEYITYAADRTPVPSIGHLLERFPSLKGARYLCVNISEQFMDADKLAEDALVKHNWREFAGFSAAYLPRSGQLMDEWVARTEGRLSVLDHPAPHPLPDYADSDDGGEGR